MKTWKQTVFIGILVILAVMATGCNRGKSSDSAAGDGFNIYSVWRHTGGADVEHGETWISDKQTTLSFFKDGENVYYTSSASGNSVWQGVLNDMGGFNYTFTPHTQFILDAGTFSDFEVQGPFAWLAVRYDSENKRLVSTDHTVEQYYEWAGESSPPDPRIFTFTAASSSPQSQTAAADISAFVGTWINSEGRTYTIPQSQSWESEFPGGFKQFENYYTWGHPAGDFGINLVPAGVDLILHGNVVPTDNTKIRLVTEDLHSAPVVYYREGELQQQLEHKELRIGSSVSGHVSRDAIDHYNIRSSEAGEIILQIESNVVIWLEVYQGDRFITTSLLDSDEYLTRVAFSAQPNIIYHLQVRSYVRDVVWEAYSITAHLGQ